MPDRLSFPVLKRKANDRAHDDDYGLDDDEVVGRKRPVKKRSSSNANQATNYRTRVCQEVEDTQLALSEGAGVSAGSDARP